MSLFILDTDHLTLFQWEHSDIKKQIASHIALETKDVLITRNRSDFEKVPGLQIEDWSKPAS